MIKEAILRWARARNPDFIIGGRERPYLRRHFLIPRNRFLNAYVHEFLRSDDDRALHDHPWLFNCSWVLDGWYIEHTACKHGCHQQERFLDQGEWKFRWGRAPHRVELVEGLHGDPAIPEYVPQAAWTVFITGPRVREWGFYCPAGWVHWKRFTAPNDKGAVGAGCDA